MNYRNHHKSQTSSTEKVSTYVEPITRMDYTRTYNLSHQYGESRPDRVGYHGNLDPEGVRTPSNLDYRGYQHYEGILEAVKSTNKAIEALAENIGKSQLANKVVPQAPVHSSISTDKVEQNHMYVFHKLFLQQKQEFEQLWNSNKVLFEENGFTVKRLQHSTEEDFNKIRCKAGDISEIRYIQKMARAHQAGCILDPDTSKEMSLESYTKSCEKDKLCGTAKEEKTASVYSREKPCWDSSKCPDSSAPLTDSALPPTRRSEGCSEQPANGCSALATVNNPVNTSSLSSLAIVESMNSSESASTNWSDHKLSSIVKNSIRSTADEIMGEVQNVRKELEAVKEKQNAMETGYADHRNDMQDIKNTIYALVQQIVEPKDNSPLMIQDSSLNATTPESRSRASRRDRIEKKDSGRSTVSSSVSVSKHGGSTSPSNGSGANGSSHPNTNFSVQQKRQLEMLDNDGEENVIVNVKNSSTDSTSKSPLPSHTEKVLNNGMTQDPKDSLNRQPPIALPAM